MERCNIPRDPEITRDMGAFAIRLSVDELFAQSDRELFRLFNLILTEGDSHE